MSEDKNTKHLWKKRTICNNCGVQGHMFFSCKRPIMSFGIICYRINPNNNMKIEYLMIRRKDTLGYVEFLRGKYNIHNDFHIRLLVQEMTYYEIDGILNNDYSQLWSNLWNKKNESYDQKIADKFNYIKNEKARILTNPNAWDEPEWGFPKGRRNNRESDYECSIREFEEETGYNSKNLIVIKNAGFVEEVFTGSNAKSYKHKYYLCKMEYKKTLCCDNYQTDEVGDLRWFTLEECLTKIRKYNYEKISMIKNIDLLINNDNYI